MSLLQKDWPNGAWSTEPDDSEWMTAAGLRAYALRHPSFGHWCGYVEVPKDHPLFGVGIGEESPALAAALERRKEQPIGEHPSFAVMLAAVFGGGVKPSPAIVFSVHGGITFADAAYWTGGDPNSWWFGFDCGHCDDVSPGMLKYGLAMLGEDAMRGQEYRELAYVFAECERLAEQLAQVTIEVKPGMREGE